MVHRFGKNQHQSLIRKVYKLVQTGTVEEYVNQFSELIDQLAAYETQTDQLHYVTRFMEGLKPSVRLLVVVQLPQDLDTAYTIALVQEEVGDGFTTLNSSHYQQRQGAVQHNVVRVTEDKRQVEPTRAPDQNRGHEDKLSALKNYRRAKGLCFTCGERWSREHKCGATVQLHVVQEMVEFFQMSDEPSAVTQETAVDMKLMHIAMDSKADTPPEKSIILQCHVHGHPTTFLLDSGSNNSFLSVEMAKHVDGHADLAQPRRVKVAGGGILQCTAYIPQCKWICGNTEFCSSFKILPLHGYDGIVGMDWLSQHSPQVVDWKQKWVAFQMHGSWICLQGAISEEFACTVVEVQLIQPSEDTAMSISAEVQSLLNSFSSVFSEPVGLPPKRQVSHSIPLVTGARPVQIRPYRFAPELKDEIEKQVEEMLKSGVIRPSDSSFASPLIMVEKKDHTWRPCVDYRHLNALTVKTKYPLPVIDELLDELHGASWFSKLDL